MVKITAKSRFSFSDTDYHSRDEANIDFCLLKASPGITFSDTKYPLDQACSYPTQNSPVQSDMHEDHNLHYMEERTSSQPKFDVQSRYTEA